MDKSKLLIFDLDGTLVDSREDVSNSINYALKATKNKTYPITEIFAHIGRPLDTIFMDLIQTTKIEKAQAASSAYRKHFFDNCTIKTLPYPFVIETLKTLSKNYQTAIATTKKTFMAVQVVDLLGIKPYINEVSGTDGFAAKPDPLILNRLLEKFEVLPENAIMVGDTESDILAAKNATVHSVAVSWGIGDQQSLKKLEPEFFIESFREIPMLIQKLWKEKK